MINVNARTGKRVGGSMDDVLVLGEYGRDARNNSYGRLLICAGEHEMVITNTFFCTQTRGKNLTPYIYSGPKPGHRRRLDDILVR